MAGLAGCGRVATYAATKAFDQVLAEGLWKELAPHGVHVLALIAGATDTPALARSGAQVTAEYPPMDPGDVAREGLAHLADGPTWFAGEGNRAGAAFFRTMERADAVAALSAGTDALYPR
jgi:short-subunit dehydrogenase